MDVVIRVELGHLVLSGLVWPINFHLPVESIIEEQIVGHSYPVGFHGMALAIVVVSNVT